MNVVDIAFGHAQRGDIGSYALAFAAGIATSIGPCVAPRYVAIAAVAGTGSRAGAARLVAFLVGTIVVYIAVASAGSLLVRLVQVSSVTYWIFALVLIVSGTFELLRNHKHRCVDGLRRPPSLGAAVLLGAATSMTVSPCCTPILLGLGALVTRNLTGLIIAFSVGHLAPLMILFGAAGGLKRMLLSHQEAVRTVTAAVTIALGSYYALIA